jgi:hypothetical protein
MNDRIKSAKLFGIDRWPRIRLAALKLAMQESQVYPGNRDNRKLERIKKRFQVGQAFAFYSTRPDLFW